MNKIIVLVGMPGAGKSICVDYLKNKKNWPSVYFGGITLDEIKKQGLEVNPDNEKRTREGLRKKFGNGVYAERIISKIDVMFNEGEEVVIADGLYSWTEYKIFKEKYGNNAVIIAIASPRHLRHARLARRPERPLNEEQVSSREYAEIENIEKGGPIANADFTITNDRSTEDLTKSLENILAQIV